MHQIAIELITHFERAPAAHPCACCDNSINWIQTSHQAFVTWTPRYTRILSCGQLVMSDFETEHFTTAHLATMLFVTFMLMKRLHSSNNKPTRLTVLVYCVFKKPTFCLKQPAWTQSTSTHVRPEFGQMYCGEMSNNCTIRLTMNKQASPSFQDPLDSTAFFKHTSQGVEHLTISTLLAQTRTPPYHVRQLTVYKRAGKYTDAAARTNTSWRILVA